MRSLHGETSHLNKDVPWRNECHVSESGTTVIVVCQSRNIKMTTNSARDGEERDKRSSRADEPPAGTNSETLSGAMVRENEHDR